MATNKITILNDTVKTERIIRHTLYCPNCGGSIRLKPDKSADEFNTFSKVPRSKLTFSDMIYSKPLNALQLPTCIICGSKFQISVDSSNFTIEIKEL